MRVVVKYLSNLLHVTIQARVVDDVMHLHVTHHCRAKFCDVITGPVMLMAGMARFAVQWRGDDVVTAYFNKLYNNFEFPGGDST